MTTPTDAGIGALIEGINQLEAEAHGAEGEPSDIRWEQAEQVHAALAAGMSTRKLAAKWINIATGEPYSHVHVAYTAKAWEVWGVNYSEQRLRFYTAYNSDEVRKKPDTNDDAGDEWYTPPWLFEALGVEFSIDVCAPADERRRTAPATVYFTESDNGLILPWYGTVWCNPPYSDPEAWALRCVEHGDALLLTHIPMNAEWCSTVWQHCDGIRLFQAMEFLRPDGSVERPGYWLQLAAFGTTAREALARLEAPPEVAENPRRVPSPLWAVSQ